MKLKPLGRRVILKEIEQKLEEEGEIVLPAEAKEQDYLQAEVIAVGSNEKIEVNKGDEVIVSGFSGMEITVDEEELTIVKDKDLLAKVQ